MLRLQQQAAAPRVHIERTREVAIRSPLAPLQERVVRSAGKPLAPDLQHDWGARLGHDLAGVRMHDDATTAGVVAATGANALSYGRHIFFAPGRLDPHSATGRTLLGHELAHTVQSRAEPAPSPIPLAPRHAGVEAEAERAGRALATSATGPVGVSAATAAPGLRGDKRITISGNNLTVTDTYVIHGDGATDAFLARFRSALDNYYNRPTFTHRGYNVRFNLSVRMARYATMSRRSRDGFTHTWDGMVDNALDTDTKLFEVRQGTGNAGGVFEITLYDGDDESVIAHEVGHYLSDKVGWSSERYTESFRSRFLPGPRTTTPDVGCEDDLMAGLGGHVSNCSLSDFLDDAINRAPPRPPATRP